MTVMKDHLKATLNIKIWEVKFSQNETITTLLILGDHFKADCQYCGSKWAFLLDANVNRYNTAKTDHSFSFWP